MKMTIVLEREMEAVKLAQGLAHQPGLHARQRIAHLALKFRPRRQCRDRIDDKNVDSAGSDQRVGNFQRLLAGVGLGDQKVVEIDPKLAGIDGIERVLGIDKGADAATALRLGHRMKRQCRLSR